MEISELAEKVDYLQGLFQRKLLEDRAKNQLIESLTVSLAERDSVETGDAFRDMFLEALVALDRLTSEDPDAALVESVSDELLEVFARRGLLQVPTEGEVDPKRHEVLRTVPATSELPTGQIVHVERAGFMLGSRLLRPARVVVAQSPSPEP